MIGTGTVCVHARNYCFEPLFVMGYSVWITSFITKCVFDLFSSATSVVSTTVFAHNPAEITTQSMP